MSYAPTLLSKMTAKQAEALEAMRSCLVCQLCDERMIEPATLLSCAHSFCHDCILEYTENSWTCPLPGCGAPVTMRGGSRESIKKNHVLSSVNNSLANIEKVLATGPTNWWVGPHKNDEGHARTAQPEDEETEEVIDLQIISKKPEGKDSEEDDNDEVSSTTKHEKFKEKNATRGRNILSLDQSLFPSNERSVLFPQNCAAPPQFSMSPIAMQSSQPEPNSPMPSIGECDGRQAVSKTATSNHPNRALVPCARKSATKKSPPVLSEPSSKRQKQQAPISTTPLDQLVDATSLKLSLAKKTPPAPTQQNPRSVNRVSFQQQPRVMLINPWWTLSSEHTRCLRKCTNDGFISILKIFSNDDLYDTEDQFDSKLDFDTEEGRQLFVTTLSAGRNDSNHVPMSFYAISTKKDFSFSLADEAITVPRSFPYYLAVACGLPIVDIGFLASARLKRRGTTSHQRYPFPSLTHSTSKARDKNSSKADYLVRGASNYSWGAPEKARTAALSRHSLWQKEEGPHASLETLLPGTDLLYGYSILLLGEFDQPNQSKRTIISKRKKKQDSEEKGGGYCTRGNMTLLLQLCGARVYDIDSVAAPKHIKRGLTVKQITGIKNIMPLGDLENGSALVNALQSGSEEGSRSNNIMVMVKDQSNSKLGSELLNQLGKVSAAPLVSCQWLLDSIGEFEVQKASDYGG